MFFVQNNTPINIIPSGLCQKTQKPRFRRTRELASCAMARSSCLPKRMSNDPMNSKASGITRYSPALLLCGLLSESAARSANARKHSQRNASAAEALNSALILGDRAK